MSGVGEFWESHYVEHGSSDQSPFTLAKHEKILSLIPDDAETLLDVGCGGGSLMLYLLKNTKLSVEGVDLSEAGVSHIVNNLKLKATVGNVLNLSFLPENSFDVVVCSEVLEHVEEKYWKDAVLELNRVAKKLVLTTNPYQEELRYHHVVCGSCDTRFHPVGHIHSVDEKFVQKNVRPYVEDLEIHYSGRRDWLSVTYSNFIRSLGLQMVNSLKVDCPVCKSDVPYKKWNILLKVFNRGYLTLKKMLGLLGFNKPATILCTFTPSLSEESR